jgi:hypothetical protein
MVPPGMVQWAVMLTSRPGRVYRGPMTESEAHAWMARAIADGCSPDTFYLAQRVVGPWVTAWRSRQVASRW